MLHISNEACMIDNWDTLTRCFMQASRVGVFSFWRHCEMTHNK